MKTTLTVVGGVLLAALAAAAADMPGMEAALLPGADRADIRYFQQAILHHVGRDRAEK